VSHVVKRSKKDPTGPCKSKTLWAVCRHRKAGLQLVDSGVLESILNNNLELIDQEKIIKILKK
jgi:hypothetical protein